MTLNLTKNEKNLGWLLPLCQFVVFPITVSMGCTTMGIYSVAVFNQICFFLSAALAAVLFRDLLGSSLRRSRSELKKTLLTVLTGLVLYWLVSSALAAAVLALKPDFANVNDASVNAMLDESPVMMALAVVFAAPLAEECLFRGWIFTGLARRSVPLAYAATSLLFCAAHIAGYVGTYDPVTLLLCFLQYVCPSLILCWTCRRADSLMAPLLLHMTINTIALFVTR